MRISIITVVYNGEKTIRRTIESVLNQTYSNIEYIIVDGKSKDSTLEIVNEYKDRIATIVSEKDKGIYDAMNKGIALATGDFVGLINADDWLEIDAAEKIVKAATDFPDQEIFHGDIRFHGKQTRIQKPPFALSSAFWNGMPVYHPTMFVKKEIYDHLNYDTEFRLLADYKFVQESINNKVKYHYLPEVLSNFSDGGASSVSFSAGLIEGHKIRRKLGYNIFSTLFSTAFKSVRRAIRTIKN